MRLLVISTLLTATAALWPIPKEVQTGNDTVWISKDIEVSYRHGNVSTAMGEGRIN